MVDAILGAAMGASAWIISSLRDAPSMRADAKISLEISLKQV
jgi:hypothetical protein